MSIIRKLVKFPITKKDLVMLYCQFVRSILEFNSSVWFSSITNEGADDLERVQRNACHIILDHEYKSYSEALEMLNLENLRERRKNLALKFGKSCLDLEEMEGIFTKSNENAHFFRNPEQFDVKFASGNRLYKSTVPTLQRLMNSAK